MGELPTGAAQDALTPRQPGGQEKFLGHLGGPVAYAAPAHRSGRIAPTSFREHPGRASGGVEGIMLSVGGLEGAHTVVLRVMLDLGLPQCFHQGWDVHRKPSAKALLQSVPTLHRVLG